MHIKYSILVLFTFCLSSIYSSAQQGNTIINQDKKIDKLLDLRKTMNKEDSDRYKIQIYSGSRGAAEKASEKFKSKYASWSPSMVFETPNYKIWAGNFRTRLEADRALKKIKKEFSGAFIFKPKKKKN